MILSLLQIFGPIRVQSFRILSGLNQEIKTYCLLKRKKTVKLYVRVYIALKKSFQIK